MKEKLKQLYIRLTNLPPVARVIVHVDLCIMIVGVLVSIFLPPPQSFTWVCYVLYALTALFLTWSVLLTVRHFPILRRRIIRFLEKYRFTQRLLVSYGFRTLMFSIVAFFLGIAVAVLNGVLAVLGGSVWYGALSLFYLVISFLRGGILIYHSHRKHRRLDGETRTEDHIRRTRLFRNCGITLIVITMILSLAVLQVSFTEKPFHYADVTLYALAVYAFYKTSMSSFHIFRARHHHDLTVRAVRNLNLMDALVSVLALQTALLQVFNDGITPSAVYNMITGFFVMAVSMAIGLSMIIVGCKHKKRLLADAKRIKEQLE